MPQFTVEPGKSKVIDDLRSATPARIAVGRAGARPTTAEWITFRRDHAMAKDAVKSEFSRQFLQWVADHGYPLVQSNACDKADFISYPPKGKRADEQTMASIKSVCPAGRDVQIVVSDGLSATAVEHNISVLLPRLLNRLEQSGISCGLPVVVRYGRVRIADQICQQLQCKLAINLIGERPGLSASDSLSAYMTYAPGGDTLSAQRTVLSNIHMLGTKPEDAAVQIAQLAATILRLKVSGVDLQQVLSHAD